MNSSYSINITNSFGKGKPTAATHEDARQGRKPSAHEDSQRKDPRHPKAARARREETRKKKQGDPEQGKGTQQHSTSFLNTDKELNTPL
jgi:hypothetical protein